MINYQQHTNIIPFNSRASVHDGCSNHFSKLVIIASTSLLNRFGTCAVNPLMCRCLATSIEGRAILQSRLLEATLCWLCCPINRIACNNLQR